MSSKTQPYSACVADECGRTVWARGLCTKHYQRWKKNGSWERPPVSPLDRWLAKVDKSGPVPEYAPHLGPCWIWTAAIFTATGYGQFNANGKPGSAHRWGYEALVAPVPDDLQLDHLCRVRHCVNPAHLEPVTAAENMRRGARANQTHCTHGHEFTPENTYIDKAGWRRCRACNRANALRYYHERRKAS